jgi:ribose transport system substrate-binding protein
MRFCPLEILLAALLLAACSQSKLAETPVQADKNQPPTIALVVKTLTNPFFIKMEQGARRAEAEFGFKLLVKSAAQETSIDQQIAIIENLISDRVQAIVVAPGSSTEMIPVLKKAQDKGILLVNIDNKLDSRAAQAAGLNNVPFISVNNEQGGYLSAKYVADQVTKPSQAIILEGIQDAENANLRKAGALRAFGENPNIKVVAMETAHWKIDEGYSVTKALFAKHPGVTIVFAANDMMALGAIQYLTEAKRGDVMVAGYDALDEALKVIREGKLEVTIDQQADLQGYIGCKTALSLLSGAKVDPLVMVDIRRISRADLK